MKKPVEIYMNRGGYLGLGLLFALMTVVFAVVLFSDPTKNTFFWVPGIGCLIGSVYYSVRLFDKKPALVFDEEGIYVKRLKKKIPWQNIQSLGIVDEESVYEENEREKIIVKRYFQFFEITERGHVNHTGHWRKFRRRELDISDERLREIVREFDRA